MRQQTEISNKIIVSSGAFLKWILEPRVFATNQFYKFVCANGKISLYPYIEATLGVECTGDFIHETTSDQLEKTRKVFRAISEQPLTLKFCDNGWIETGIIIS